MIYSTWGIHPLKASLFDDAMEKTLETYLKSPRSVAVGETGLDYVKLDSANAGPAKFIQKMVFARHLALAKKLNKPVTVHMRGAEQDLYDLLRDNLPEEHPIHMQCYTGTTELVKMLMDTFPNVYFGVAGLATYAGAAGKRDDIVRYLPLNRIVFESVSPRKYLARQRSREDKHLKFTVSSPLDIAPEPFRGKVGHSGLIPYIAERVAAIKGVNIDEVYANALQNSNACFNINVA